MSALPELVHLALLLSTKAPSISNRQVDPRRFERQHCTTNWIPYSVPESWLTRTFRFLFWTKYQTRIEGSLLDWQSNPFAFRFGGGLRFLPIESLRRRYGARLSPFLEVVHLAYRAVHQKREMERSRNRSFARTRLLISLSGLQDFRCLRLKRSEAKEVPKSWCRTN